MNMFQIFYAFKYYSFIMFNIDKKIMLLLKSYSSILYYFSNCVRKATLEPFLNKLSLFLYFNLVLDLVTWMP